MAPNNDMTMSRFLFAILQQKNLKDIDWNLVAKNPILPQSITNGHAARMRYSRFKQSLEGHAPAPRNRNSHKMKATKARKEPKSKKTKDEQIKTEPNIPLDSQQQVSQSGSLCLVKDESLFKTEVGQPPHPDSQQTPTELSHHPMSAGHIYSSSRLLTPCSDTDMFAHMHRGPATSPANEHHHEQPFNYPGANDQCAGNESHNWHPSPSSFFPLYDSDGYGASPFSVQHAALHAEHFGISPSDMMTPNASHVPVKHEEWDAQYNTS